jgi:glycosyltransferase involved in cell wall biosynthesis
MPLSLGRGVGVRLSQSQTLNLKIFISIPWFLPAFRAGGPIQSIANLVKEYRKDVEYYIFCGDTDLNGGALENVTIGEWTRFNDYTSVWYADNKKASDSLVRQAEDLKPDIIYIVGMYSWHYNIVPMIFCKAPKKILSTRGMLHPGALSQKKWKKKMYLQLFKLFEYHYKIIFHATDEDERNYISSYFGSTAQIFTAGNFPNNIGELPVASNQVGQLKLITIALISPMKNILPVLDALEKITALIQYDIYGPVKDFNYWEQCKEKIKALPGNITVSYHKEIEPSKVKEALAQSHVFILPSKSENFGHAIYEALSAGLPVITSNNTPWNHLQSSLAGINASPEIQAELVQAIDFFAAMDESTLAKWRRGALTYAANAIDLEKLRYQYDTMFTSPSISQDSRRGDSG